MLVISRKMTMLKNQAEACGEEREVEFAFKITRVDIPDSQGLVSSHTDKYIWSWFRKLRVDNLPLVSLQRPEFTKLRLLIPAAEIGDDIEDREDVDEFVFTNDNELGVFSKAVKQKQVKES